MFIDRLVQAHDDGEYVHKFGRRIFVVLDASRTCFLVLSLPVFCVSVLSSSSSDRFHGPLVGLLCPYFSVRASVAV